MAEIDIPLNFEIFADEIAIMHITDYVHPIRHILGKLVIDRHNKVRTVIAKIGHLKDTF